MSSSQLQALAKVRGMLDFVLHPSSPDTSGIPVGDEKLRKVMEWVFKREDPIDGELLPDACQVCAPQRSFWPRACLRTSSPATLLNGIEPEDGGGVGTPFESDGNGDCLLNSVAAFFAKDGGRGVRSAVKTMAVKLRVSVVLYGLKYMELFLLEQDEHLGAWYNYTSDVRERLGKNGWDVAPDRGNNWHVGSSKCARLMFLAQLRSIAKPGDVEAKTKEAATASKGKLADAVLGLERKEMTEDEEEDVMHRLTRAHTRAFATQAARMETLVAGKKCEGYMTDLITNKTKWTFCCRPTVLTLGMVATQRTEGLFGVAKRSGVEKKLSLCALWDRLQHLSKMIAIETARLETPPITPGVAFRDKHVEEFFQPVKQELLACGASQYCQKVDGSESYDVELVTSGNVDEDGQPLPLHDDDFVQIRNLRLKLNILQVAPPDTDLERDSHYFAVLVNLIGRTGGEDELSFTHAFDGACFHNRWRQSDDGKVLPWSVSLVLSSSGHGEGWDGHRQGCDAHCWGPTCDESFDGAHPAERAVRAAQDRSAGDKRRVYAHLMAKGKENVGDIIRSVPLHQALSVQVKVDNFLGYLLKETAGDTGGPKNPGQAPTKGRPEKDGKEGAAGNPAGQQGKSRQTRRMRDFSDVPRTNKRRKLKGADTST
ncbi:unnamed protein product [Ectocarpus sp. CCAP 1310/34]|nr:unnamed protein product [Ectocarpus sp. CCAP 1310/34]